MEVFVSLRVPPWRTVKQGLISQFRCIYMFDLANRVGFRAATSLVTLFSGWNRSSDGRSIWWRCPDRLWPYSGDISSKVRLLTLFGPRGRFWPSLVGLRVPVPSGLAEGGKIVWSMFEYFWTMLYYVHVTGTVLGGGFRIGQAGCELAWWLKFPESFPPHPPPGWGHKWSHEWVTSDPATWVQSAPQVLWGHCRTFRISWSKQSNWFQWRRSSGNVLNPKSWPRWFCKMLSRPRWQGRTLKFNWGHVQRRNQDKLKLSQTAHHKDVSCDLRRNPNWKFVRWFQSTGKSSTM